MTSHHKYNLSLAFVFVSTALSSFLFTSQAFGAIPVFERNALIAIYNNTGGENWVFDNGWIGPPGTEGDWEGVTVENGHVTQGEIPILETVDLRMIPQIPESIGYLTQIRTLMICFGRMFGDVGEERSLIQASRDTLFMLGDDRQLDGGLAWDHTAVHLIFTRIDASEFDSSDQPLVGQQFFGNVKGDFLSSVPGIKKK